MNSAEKDSTPQISKPSIYKMMGTVTLRNGFKSCRVLGKNLKGIIESTTIPEKKFRYGLGHKPTK